MKIGKKHRDKIYRGQWACTMREDGSIIDENTNKPFEPMASLSPEDGPCRVKVRWTSDPGTSALGNLVQVRETHSRAVYGEFWLENGVIKSGKPPIGEMLGDKPVRAVTLEELIAVAICGETGFCGIDITFDGLDDTYDGMGPSSYHFPDRGPQQSLQSQQ